MAYDDNPSLPYPNSTTSPVAPISADRSPATIQTTSPSTAVADPEPRPTTSIGVLRKQFGPHFARGYGDNDTLAEVLANAGVSTLDEYREGNTTGATS